MAKKLSKVRDRIVEFKRVKASQIVGAPWNFRTHPDRQRDVVVGSLEELGITDPLKTRRVGKGVYQLWDGHLRDEILKAVGPDTLVPIIVTDLTEKEAKKAMAVHDPSGDLAGVDAKALGALLKDVDTDSAPLISLFSELSAGHGALKPQELELDIDDEEDSAAPDVSELSPSHVRMVQLFLDKGTIADFERYVSKLGARYGTATLTDTVMECLRRACAKKKVVK